MAALARVHELLREAGIAYWLFGGWAVDFYAGEVTRPHDDVDIAVWLEDLPRIVELLEADGWRHAPDEDEDGGTGYEREGVRLELTYLARDGDEVFTPMREGRGTWSPDALGPDERELDGVRARVVALEALWRGKSRPREDPGDADKDRADFERALAGRDEFVASVGARLASPSSATGRRGPGKPGPYADLTATARWL